MNPVAMILVCEAGRNPNHERRGVLCTVLANGTERVHSAQIWSHTEAHQIARRFRLPLSTRFEGENTNRRAELEVI